VNATMLTVYVSTNGCVEGQLSSTYVEQFFRKNKLAVTRDPEQADLLVFYACGLTEQKEKDSLSIIIRLQERMKPTARLVVWGCLPRINPKSLRTIYDGPILGPTDTSFFEKILEKTTVSLDSVLEARAANMLIATETSESNECYCTDKLANAIIFAKQLMGRLRARADKATNFFIRVATGCTGRCTYCSERCVFGRIQSRPIEKIMSEFKWGLQQGYNRFSLIATDLGAYGKDIGLTLPDLLAKMIKTNYKKNYKLILNQVEPSYLKEMFYDLEEILASGKVEALNCPVQSGSDRILELMGRPYTADEWKEYMVRINRKFPNIQLSTHFMVGFPTETDDDFRATLKLLDYPLFLYNIYLFKFSKRPGVYASRIPGQIPEETKESRCRKLLQKHARKYALNAPIMYVRRLF